MRRRMRSTRIDARWKDIWRRCTILRMKKRRLRSHAMIFERFACNRFARDSTIASLSFAWNRNDEGASISSIVSIEGSISHAMAFSHAINEVFDSMRVKLEQKYERSRRDWKSIFEKLQFTSNSYANQISFWLRIIDINRWMTKLHRDKKRLRELLHANTNDEFFFMTTSIELQLIACNKCYRTSNTLLDRSSDVS